MAGGKGPHWPRLAGSLANSHMQWKRALGIPLSHRMFPARQVCRCGTFDLQLNHINIKGMDFAQDSDEYVPETEPHDLVTVSRIRSWAFRLSHLNVVDLVEGDFQG